MDFVKARKSSLMPDEIKEYLAIYTTEDQDSYLFDTIIAGDIFELQEVIKGQQEKEVCCEPRKNSEKISVNKLIRNFHLFLI